MPSKASTVDHEVRILTLQPAEDGRQIGARTKLTELLDARKDDIHAAIGQAVEILRGSASQAKDETGWRVASIEATFGIVLTAEAGVVISKTSAEASLEVSITIEQR
jgi:hypothetical protein